MKHFPASKSFLFSLGFACALALPAMMAPSAHAFGLGGGTTADVKNTKHIRDLYENFVKEWNKHDVKAMAAHWAIDGDHVEPDGTVAKGRDEVAAMLEKQHAGVFKKSKLKLVMRPAWIISDTVALVDGTYELSGAELPDGTAIPPRQGMLTSVLILERNDWSIAASRLMIPTTLPYKKPAGTAGAAATAAPAAATEAPAKKK